ncbi:response regulator [Pedobacter sp. HMF7647]|uniref:Response regulator n=1 Tax=Hufsiella arboris TaxID=2695275 RepID=A0A7K1YBD1_9SPHI|nr:sigma-54 dependent transcriptional regulator [Hufsiella arboris]MXV51883.1 response regulator [Hufsiella arboris]
MAKILLIEDDTTFVELLRFFLTKHGHELLIKNDIKSGLSALNEDTFDLLLLDYRLPDGTSMEILNYKSERALTLPAIMMTTFNDVRIAVKAVRSGAFDYITKPVNPDELLMIINEALLEKKNIENLSSLQTLPDFIEGDSEEAQKIQEYSSLVGPTDMSVLIQGESGTGKEYAARLIHQKSNRAKNPFIAIDCGALSKDLAASELFGHVKGAFTGAIQDKKGQFEHASGGTLFLDEIGNLSYEVQVKLLRALQERTIQPLGSLKNIPVDVRIISATNEDLLNSIEKGDFREDLYHRINEFKIQVPALRDRGNDIDLFIEHFVKQSNTELNRNVKTVSTEVKEIFHRYEWPGNLRELKNVIKRMVLLSPGEKAELATLPEEMIAAVNDQPQKNTGSDIKAANEATEKKLIQQTLVKVKYNKSLAARLLNIDRKTLYLKMEKYGIE